MRPLTVFSYLAAFTSFIFVSINFLPSGINVLAAPTCNELALSWVPAGRNRYLKSVQGDDMVFMWRVYSLLELLIIAGPLLGVQQRAWALQLFLLEVVNTGYHAYALTYGFHTLDDWTCMASTGIFHPIALLVGIWAFLATEDPEKKDA